jgi:RNA polymerase sigma-70 factor, ECF subfamily
VTADVEAAVAEAFHAEWGRVVATLVRLTGDWDLAEECAQDAFATALERWPRDGIPRRPGGWLTTVARHRAVDRARRALVGEAKTREVAVMTAQGDDGLSDEEDVPDDRLRLMFTCCHPALTFEAQVALTLRTLAGMTTPEIAHAFLVPEATMAQRLVRAKRKIRHAGIPFTVPPPYQLVERTAAVLAVVYLLFNEGYSASSGADVVRRSLTTEAIRLGRVLCTLMPDEPEALGLLALMLFHDARSAARVDGNGDIVMLTEQDPTLWDAAAIAEGRLRLDAATRLGRPGPFQLQAAIAACHVRQGGTTNWSEIANLYDHLFAMTPSAVIALNRAVAVSMCNGPEAGLVLLDRIAPDGELREYHLLPAARADMLRRLGRRSEAADAYRRAFDLAGTDAERRYLERRLLEASA